ncbi:MAG: hypothetical protein V3T07_01975 [Myxococcota bacterium]
MPWWPFAPVRLAVALWALLAAPAGATTIWWQAEGAWDDPAHWQYTDGSSGVPQPDEDVYITSHGHADGRPPHVPGTAELSTSARVHGIYVGGWYKSLDALFGPPTGHEGRLTLLEGADLFDDSYLRVGVRGARGEVTQLGGQNGPTLITLGWLSSDSEGVYRLEGGHLLAKISVGSTGRGRLEARGGLMRGDTFVGHGYGSQSPSGFLPGVGVADFAGDVEYVTGNLWVGLAAGSAGIVTIRENAKLFLSGITVGAGSTGAVVQTGGTVTAIRILVHGTYTLAGPSWLGQGSADRDGELRIAVDGELVVIGPEPTALVMRLEHEGLLTFRLQNGAVAPLTVRSARFGKWARIRVIEDGEPAAPGTQVLLVAAREGIEGRPSLEQGDGWGLQLLDENTLVARKH